MSLNFQIAIAVGFGGAFGSILRFYAVDYVHKMELGNFPFGILLVNIFGSFIIGILYAYFSTHDVSTILKAFLIAGFLGGLTTFSTFALESVTLIQKGDILSGLLYIVFSVAGGMLAVVLTQFL